MSGTLVCDRGHAEPDACLHRLCPACGAPLTFQYDVWQAHERLRRAA